MHVHKLEATFYCSLSEKRTAFLLYARGKAGKRNAAVLYKQP